MENSFKKIIVNDKTRLRINCGLFLRVWHSLWHLYEKYSLYQYTSLICLCSPYKAEVHPDKSTVFRVSINDFAVLLVCYPGGCSGGGRRGDIEDSLFIKCQITWLWNFSIFLKFSYSSASFEKKNINISSGFKPLNWQI